MNKLPITNINKWTKYNHHERYMWTKHYEEFAYYDYAFPHLIVNSNALDEKHTIHENVINDQEEGIMIIWMDNPFNLNYNKDNYILNHD